MEGKVGWLKEQKKFDMEGRDRKKREKKEEKE